MPLEPGSKLGTYEILSTLGVGGMGEVYRAKDTKLAREVAIKLLLEEVSADPERLARFEREARVLASLNHNCIATLHGFEKDDDTNFLVMELVEATPDRLRRLLARCLDRDPRRRLRDIGETWVALDAVAAGEAATAESPIPPQVRAAPPTTGAGMGSRLAWLAAGALVAGAGVWAWMRPAPAPTAPVRRFTIDLGPTSPIPVMEATTMLAFSPDGRELVASINRSGGLPSLFRRSLDRLELTPIGGTGFAYAPFYSPDGEWIAFHEPGSRKLKKVPTEGGAVQTLCDAYPPLGGAWLEDGTLVFASQGPHSPTLFRVASTGGEPQALTAPEQFEDHVFPVALPGDKGVLFTRGSASSQGRRSSIDLLDLETGASAPLVENGALANYAASGHIVFVREGALWAVPFDLEALAVTGPEALVQNGVEGGLAYTPWAISAQGLLVYSPLTEDRLGGSYGLAWLDRQGSEEPIEMGAGSFGEVRLSHDGRKLAILVTEAQQFGSDLWVYDLGGRPPIRVTSGELISSPVWTPDDGAITFHDVAAGQVRTVAVDGSSRVDEIVEVLVSGVGGPRGWTPDGRELLVGLSGGTGGEGAHTVVVSEAGKRRRLIQTGFHVTGADLSPDGNWVAYLSNATGAFEVYVGAYPGPGPQHRVSEDGAQAVRWSRSGRELFFSSGVRLMAATFDPGTEPEIGTPVRLFNRRTLFWDVAPDGRILAVLPDAEGTSSSHLVLVDGFLDELRRLAPTE